MKNEKFINDTQTVLKFIQLYCDKQHNDKHKNSEELDLIYLDKNLDIKVKYTLCSTCKDTFFYSYQRLQECPHDEKPRCRKCPNPCYERSRWKELAKIMKYSGIRLGLTKVKKLFNKHK